MWIFTLVFIFMMAGFLSFVWKEDICDTLPMTVAAFLLMLYILAFFGFLPAADYMSAGILFVGMVILLFRKQDERTLFFNSLKQSILTPKFRILLFLMISVTFLTKDRIALWWDDINFWATDAKALYFTGSFAGKYGNVAPEFGDYPPAIQLMKWWFLQTNKEVFVEGLMFGAYYCMNMIFLFPLLKHIKSRNYGVAGLGCLTICLLPGIADGVSFQGTCADVTMGIVYGALLLAVWDDKEHQNFFYYGRITLYLSVLVLTKSVGIEWAVFAILFLILKRKFQKEKAVSLKRDTFYMSLVTVITFATEGSWLLYCLMQRRVAKLTSSGVKLAVGGKFRLPDNIKERIVLFLKGFILYPMHTEKNIVFDLSAFGLLILILAALVIMKKTGKLCRREYKKLILFTILTSFAAYAIIFLGHITIFAGELQYEDPAVMAISIARYGAPFTIGMLYLILGIVMERLPGKKGFIICMLMVLLTTFYPGYYRALIGYRDTLPQDMADRKAMIEEDSEYFLTQLSKFPQLVGKRTLYLRNDHVIHWVKDTYVNYQASPVAVVYNGIAADTMTKQDVEDKIRQSHATYLYVDAVEGDIASLFEDMLTDEKFQPEAFYQITEEEGQLHLFPLQKQNSK